MDVKSQSLAECLPVYGEDGREFLLMNGLE